jgi:hypothetical protein
MDTAYCGNIEAASSRDPNTVELALGKDIQNRDRRNMF